MRNKRKKKNNNQAKVLKFWAQLWILSGLFVSSWIIKIIKLFCLALKIITHVPILRHAWYYGTYAPKTKKSVQFPLRGLLVYMEASHVFLVYMEASLVFPNKPSDWQSPIPFQLLSECLIIDFVLPMYLCKKESIDIVLELMFGVFFLGGGGLLWRGWCGIWGVRLNL